MAWLWIAPAGLALVGAAVVAGLARRTAEELIGLRAELEKLRGVVRR